MKVFVLTIGSFRGALERQEIFDIEQLEYVAKQVEKGVCLEQAFTDQGLKSGFQFAHLFYNCGVTQRHDKMTDDELNDILGLND